MKILDLQQGSEPWHAARATHNCASDAAAVMSASGNESRNDLIKRLATGIAPEVTAFQQSIFDRGHAMEAAIRPHIEKLIGEDLYPTVGERDDFLASFDGMTMSGDINFEHKQWNEELAAQVRAGEIPPSHYWQLEHQHYVNAKAKKTIFVVSDGTPENMVYAWYRPVPGRLAKLLAGWKQLREDVQNYVPSEAPVATPKAQVESLPAVAVRVDGSIAIVDNLDVFGTALKDFIARINQKPNTDEEFAAAEAAVKTLEKAESALDAAKSSGLAQVASVDQMVRTVDTLSGLARATRLALDKLVKQRKEQIKLEIVAGAQKKLSEHIAAINKRLAPVVLPTIAADFAGVIKGKKTVTNLRGAADDELARAKIEANETAEKIDANLRFLTEQATEHRFLFNDLQTIALKAPDDFAALVENRIATHKAAEQKRLDDEREKIRQEEAARAQREAEARMAQARVEIRAEEQEKAREVDTAPAPTPAPIPRTGGGGYGGDPILARRAATRAPVTIEQPVTRECPDGEEILRVLASHYRTDRNTVLGWLVQLDLTLAKV